MNLSHDNLANYYKTNFSLMQFHKYSLGELDEMLPWERDIYTTMLVNHIKEDAERRHLLQQQAKFSH